MPALWPVGVGTALLEVHPWNKEAPLFASRSCKKLAFKNGVELMGYKLPILTSFSILFFSKLSLHGMCLKLMGTYKRGLSTLQRCSDTIPNQMWHKPSLVK